MIERAARCLETGGQATFRGIKKQFRSRRHLHSAFWSHGAGDIDLPAWWIFLLRTPTYNEEACRSRSRGEFRAAVSQSLEDIFLGFLYPVRTLVLIQKIKRSTTAYQLAAQSAKQYKRSYTSIAEKFIARAQAAVGEGNSFSTSDAPVSRTTGDALRNGIIEILDSVDHDGLHDELWKHYQDFLETSQELLPQELLKMLRSLMLSPRSVDNERALALFESIPLRNRRAIHYSYAVSAALALKDIDTALAIHREAISRINGSVGTAAIMGFTIQQELWAVAVETWHPLWEHKLSYYTRPDIWAAIDALPIDTLIGKARSAAEFAIKTSECVEGQGAVAAREFALELARRAFSVRGTAYNIDSHWDLVEKVSMLDDAGTLVRTLALDQLLSVDNSDSKRQALRLYHVLRMDSSFSPDRNILEGIIKHLFSTKSIRGLSMIINDWRGHLTRFPAGYALTAAKIFARGGEVDSVQKILDDFLSEHGKPKHNTLYHCMLLAHSRRADTTGVSNCLKYLQETFGFKPDTKGWNSMIATYARVGDVDGALNFLRDMTDSGQRPDSTTYFLLMSMFGKRGDRDAVEHLYEQSKVDGVPTTTQMIDAIVLANVNDGNLREAERIAEQALHMESSGSRTFMWNTIINAYAIRNEVVKVSEVHRRMHEAGVPYNNMTYAALMTSLTIARLPNGARKIMNTIMPQNNVKRTALHYAIVMGGYLMTREYNKIFQLYKKMLRSNLTPNMSTQNVLLRAAASVDRATEPASESQSENTEFRRARQTFEQTLDNLNPTELATSEPRLFVGPHPLDEAFSSTYFDYLIFLYGKASAFQKVSELYDRYVATRQELGSKDEDIETLPPVRLLSALMVAHLQTDNFSDIDQCWELALEKSRHLVCKQNADISQGNWVLRSRRFVINLPLHQYILSLTKQARTEDIIRTVDSLQYSGYALNSSNWNKYIQALVRSPLTDHRVLAFRLCEHELIPNWSGWASLGSPQYMKEKMYKMHRFMLLRQDQRMPSYLTLVWLARAYLEARSEGKGGTMRALERNGPKTIDAITNMPHLNDREQSEILRQEV
ncbi:hypothetical protein ACLMJK_001773 [Lecanora helva]